MGRGLCDWRLTRPAPGGPTLNFTTPYHILRYDLAMQGIRLKLIAAADPDMFQNRLDRLLESLPKETLIVDIKFSTANSGSQTTYAALVQYKAAEEWIE